MTTQPVAYRWNGRCNERIGAWPPPRPKLVLITTPIGPTPGDYTRDLIDEIIWWHNATGNPVTYAQVMGRDKYRQIVYARRDCMRRIRDVLGWSMPVIGRYFGYDHSSVMHHMNPEKYAAKLRRKRAARHCVPDSTNADARG